MTPSLLALAESGGVKLAASFFNMSLELLLLPLERLILEPQSPQHTKQVYSRQALEEWRNPRSDMGVSTGHDDGPIGEHQKSSSLEQCVAHLPGKVLITVARVGSQHHENESTHHQQLRLRFAPVASRHVVVIAGFIRHQLRHSLSVRKGDAQ